MKPVILLDCTLRDGGYYNTWDFSKKLIEEYLLAMRSAQIDYVEIGLKSLDRNGYKGPCAYSSDSFIDSLSVPDGTNLGVMVNASEILGGDKSFEESLALLFVREASESQVKLVRVACHIHEFPDALPAANWLKEKGYIVGFNLMQIASQPYEKITQLAEMASNYPLDVLYFADSMGSMDAHDTRAIVKALQAGWQGPIGIHTHDNMGNALANSVAAAESGVQWIDGTVTGMGRGPGNVKTEYLVLALESEREKTGNTTPLLNLIRTHFGPMQEKCGWGSNPYYYLAGKHGIHPSFIQEMLNDKRYNAEDILAVIEYLKTVNGSKFSKDTLEKARNFYQGEPRGTWNPKDKIAGNDVLILGSGPGVALHSEAIERFIFERKPTVIALNAQRSLKEELIDIRTACHPIRLVADCDDHMRLPQPLAIPASMLPQKTREALQGKELLDFGISVTGAGFDICNHYAALPGSLVVAYALSIATSGGANTIYLAGFDGYGADDPRRAEADNVFRKYKDNSKAANLLSITPTLYELECTSVYALVQ